MNRRVFDLIIVFRLIILVMIKLVFVKLFLHLILDLCLELHFDVITRVQLPIKSNNIGYFVIIIIIENGNKSYLFDWLRLFEFLDFCLGVFIFVVAEFEVFG